MPSPENGASFNIFNPHVNGNAKDSSLPYFDAKGLAGMNKKEISEFAKEQGEAPGAVKTLFSIKREKFLERTPRQITHPTRKEKYKIRR